MNRNEAQQSAQEYGATKEGKNMETEVQSHWCDCEQCTNHASTMGVAMCICDTCEMHRQPSACSCVLCLMHNDREILIGTSRCYCEWCRVHRKNPRVSAYRIAELQAELVCVCEKCNRHRTYRQQFNNDTPCPCYRCKRHRAIPVEAPVDTAPDEDLPDVFGMLQPQAASVRCGCRRCARHRAIASPDQCDCMFCRAHAEQAIVLEPVYPQLDASMAGPEYRTGYERGQAAQEAADIVKGVRQVQYGQPEDSFGAIAALYDAYMAYAGNKYADGTYTKAHREAMHLALMKIGRIAAGANAKPDSYIDACGYLDIACSLHYPAEDA